MSNPFLEEQTAKFSVTKYVRELFDGKKPGDTFEVELNGFTPTTVRAHIHQVVGTGKYRTKMRDGKMYALILED